MCSPFTRLRQRHACRPGASARPILPLPPLPAEIICTGSRSPLSYRGVEELMLERGIIASYESVWCWRLKFGPNYTADIR